MLFLPENVSFLGENFTESLAIAEPLHPPGPTLERYCRLAAASGVWLSLGGFQEAGPDPGHLYNTHVVISSSGEVAATYRKVHLFNVDVPGGPVLMESRFTAPGERLAVCDSPAGRLGLSVCYDLRFPELYQRLAFDLGAQLLLVPSAFTVATGRAHWEVLLRARAIETQCYVVAAAQAGKHNARRESYGHSLMIDPWGEVVARLEDPLATGIACADIDLEKLRSIRTRMPVAEHRALGRPAVLQGAAAAAQAHEAPVASGGTSASLPARSVLTSSPTLSSGPQTVGARRVRAKMVARAVASALALALVATCLGPAAGARKLAATAGAPAPGGEYFVRIENGEFVAGCERFVMSGWNSWEMVEAGAGAPSLSGASLPVNVTGPRMVRELVARGKELGFNTMRTWAHAVNAQYATQTAPGVFSEPALRGLDLLLDEARKAGIRLILAFTSNWTPTGGIPEYLKWAGTDQQVDFYTRDDIKGWYRGWVEAVVNRVNTINGRTYKDDPTVLAWNLLNEPRCKGCPPGTVAAWYDEMAQFVKSVDPNHLVSTGEEGFYACCGNQANPGQPYSEWAAEEGQDFIKDHSSPAIDFATIHAWVDNWQQVDPAWLTAWIESHEKDAREVLKKPVVLEEHGKWVTDNATIGGKFVSATLEERNSFMDVAYGAIDNLLRAPGSAFKGALFWQWFSPGQEAPASEGGGRGLFGIYETDDAFRPILENARAVQDLNKGPVAGCVPAQHRAAPTVSNDCSSTWVDGEAGTGKEGPACDVPINECVRGTAVCDPKAACVDTDAGYSCECWWGYKGDGNTCKPDPEALQALEALYWNQPQGLACDAGMDVAWPSTAPGYLYDPLGSFAVGRPDGAGSFGSRANVTLEMCRVACQAAPDCEGFVINEVLQQCFLKREQCPSANFCWGQEVLCNSTNDRGGLFSFPCGHWMSYYRLDMDVGRACSNITYTEPDLAARSTPDVLQVFADFEKKLAEGAGEGLARPAGGEPAAPPQPATSSQPGSSVALLEPVPPVQAQSQP
ncbi:nitrilase 2 [Micractinium conductrix]|uniref:mannan endo-1,4-beta-mannosidase n=1 Tax=Micractinium conductrix TaxID=554055 RepID=A0A2P6VQT6_9CHLO|nr:nitrilase 2 [Micractinium conductrix]|eukprot:PSC76452.1 nitrilase 2 [Micractinium conductrix]